MPRRPFYQPRHAAGSVDSDRRRAETDYTRAWSVVHAVRRHPDSHPCSIAAAVQLAVELRMTTSPTEEAAA